MAEAWHTACRALALAAHDPALGGVHIRARMGPARSALPLPRGVMLHPGLDDEALFGGLDLPATLAHGRAVRRPGLLDRDGPLILNMAERCPPGLAARLAAHLDDRPRCLVLLDESDGDDMPPAALQDRVAFFADLGDVALSDLTGPPQVRFAPTPRLAPEQLDRITAIAFELGVESLRAPLFAARSACALAAMEGRQAVDDDALAQACAMVLAHRATRLPGPPEENSAEPETAPPDARTDADDREDAADTQPPSDVLLDAVRAMLPDGLLERLGSRRSRGGAGTGSGAERRGNRRGRPIPSRPGAPGAGGRIDVTATLRAAAPWQTIRRAETGRTGLQIRASDIHLRAYRTPTDRVLIFTVDASGSAAMARLAEAKGAVETLLAQAYARRDHVALLAFRKDGAELLLPPTRSLVQTRRRLAELPGGGGTPLAAGLEAARDLAETVRRRGMTPTICLLTDGRANIARDGRADRAAAASDARAAATAIRAGGIDALVIDTGARAAPQLRTLAEVLDATYLALPRADANRLARAVDAALPA